ncbi:GGDEF domain-containing protein [Aliiglaciecola sp. CAU 1673]|uniref:GGDEF domain-containing protein n=1 Tax=Aliiglaciecola sp. CAU 1673 TaxID=3032595 RepID=UPI0023DA6839|nr:GGDEF domain-containing protein [Aliiglaciecola sp. CAU 1673]MDF2178856.1 GGDEF domain-containing protein [Aliiglaciecola sp. CAU 1673]
MTQLSSLSFHFSILFIATAAYFLFVLILPRSNNADQNRALTCFQYAFVLPLMAWSGYALQFYDWPVLSIVLTNGSLLLAFYLFYLGVRSRAKLDISAKSVLFIALHILLFVLMQLLLNSLSDSAVPSELNAVIHHTIPIILTLKLSWSRSKQNVGDKLIRMVLLMIWLVVLIFLPLYQHLWVTTEENLINVTTLIALVLESALFAGVALSYIYDLVEKLKNDAFTDSLTGLRNRHFLSRIVAGMFASAKRYQYATSVILADIDDFKQLNDSMGHAVGDDAIRAVAAVLKNSIREEDVLVRFGGEEFLVLLPNADMDTAKLIAERMCRLTQTLSVPGREKLTLSLGVSQVAGLSDLEAAIHRADEAMYKAKEQGKNRVEVDPDIPHGASVLHTH